MLYISKVESESRITVTDTEDGVSEIYTDSQIARFISKYKLNIYGTSYYNYKANCTPLTLNKKLSIPRLKKLLEDWKKLHNQWTGYPVEDYLAELQIGTVITVEYHDNYPESNRVFYGKSQLKKIGQDSWYFEDTNNIASGDVGDSRFGAQCLESSCVYCKCDRIY